MRKLVGKSLVVISFSMLIVVTSIFGLGVKRVYASLFGEENVILSKMLVEDIKHSLSLESIFKAGVQEIKELNKKYLYDKWINKGLDEVKDFGFLSELKTDDYIVGTFQRDVGKLGMKYQGEEFRFDNIDDWFEQVWDLAPSQFQKSSLRDIVSRESAELALESYIWNMEYNNKIRLRYDQLQDSATNSNPGLANRITAQTNALQTYQLSNISDTQGRIMQMMAIRRLEKMQQEKQTQNYFKDSFLGLKSIYKGLSGGK